MNAPNITKLVKEAMGLPVEARAALASELIESLERRGNTATEAAWGREIVKRLNELKNGKVRTISWSQTRKQIIGNRRMSPAA